MKLTIKCYLINLYYVMKAFKDGIMLKHYQLVSTDHYGILSRFL